MELRWKKIWKFVTRTDGTEVGKVNGDFHEKQLDWLVESEKLNEDKLGGKIEVRIECILVGGTVGSKLRIFDGKLLIICRKMK